MIPAECPMNPAEFATLAQAERGLWWFRGMERILFELLDPLDASRRISRVMEAGSGTGHMAEVLQQRYGWRMFPAELAWEGVSRTARGGGIWPVQGDIAACPFREGAFDAVVSLDVLVHFPRGEEVRALKEFARIVKPGGLLVIRVSALDILRSRHSIFTHERQRFTRSRLIDAARASGFDIQRCTYANSLLMPVALARFRVWEPLMRRPPASGTSLVPRWLDRLLYVPLAIESFLISKGLNLPAGQSLILIGTRK
ncbi:MAG: class I SAM-dependent methyltransferase [Bryobacterales bacterium]|nr:class I SAM-dependent methyltransferase [Bryobacterales bacterium]